MRRFLPCILVAACAAPGYERALAVTVDAAGTPAGRIGFGMPRGKQRIWVTEAHLTVDTDGFGAVVGGIAVRARHGLTPRAQLGFGLASQGSITGKCTVHEDGSQDCVDGIGPYGEAGGGVDVPLAGNLWLRAGVGGNVYLNGDTLESRVFGLVGVVWK